MENMQAADRLRDGTGDSRWIHRQGECTRKDEAVVSSYGENNCQGLLSAVLSVLHFSLILFFFSSWEQLHLNQRYCHWLNPVEMSWVFRNVCQKMPSEDHFQSVLKTPRRVMFSPNSMWLIFLEASGFLALCFKDGLPVGITLWQWDLANCSFPLQRPRFLFKENFGEVKKLQTICFSFPQASPKWSILPHKHKGKLGGECQS